MVYCSENNDGIKDNSQVKDPVLMEEEEHMGLEDVGQVADCQPVGAHQADGERWAMGGHRSGE